MFFEKFEEIVTYNTRGVQEIRNILLDIEGVSYFSPVSSKNEYGRVVAKFTKAYLKNGDSLNLNIDFDEILKKFSI